MLKYVDTLVSFQEVPDEISLCINLSNCPNNCIGCHSPWLKQDTGTKLDVNSLFDLINNNRGITCICFMGGDSDPVELNELAFAIKLRSDYPYKVAWYSGKDYILPGIDIDNFDYIKIGPYIEEKGGLNNPDTNQKMFKIGKDGIINITNKFWKNDRTEKESTC